MPYKVAKSSQCPDSKPWACINEVTGRVMGCHPTKAHAEKQMAALYAVEPMMPVKGKPTYKVERLNTCPMAQPNPASRNAAMSRMGGRYGRPESQKPTER